MNIVTRPFGSTSGLSKPFKPPSFVNKAGSSNLSNPPPPPPVVRPPPITKPSVPKVKSRVGVPITRVPDIRVRVEEEVFAHVETADEERKVVFPWFIHLDRS